MSYDRKKPKLEYLDPKSVSKVFTEIDLYINNFDVYEIKNSADLRKTLQGGKFTPLEKFFITSYLKHYLDIKNTNSLLSKKIRKKEISLDFDEPEDLLDWKEKITNHAREIFVVIEICDQVIKSSTKAILRTQQNEQSFQNLNIAPFHTRLPLPTHYDKRKERKIFLENVFEQLYKAGFDKEIAWRIIHNSFKIDNRIFIPEFLHIEFGDSKILHGCFYEIYKLYRELRKELKRDAKKHEKEIKIKNKKNPQASSPEKKIKRVNLTNKSNDAQFKDLTSKIEIAYIMLLAFPQFRRNFDNYLLNNKDENIKTYLKIMSKNIRDYNKV